MTENKKFYWLRLKRDFFKRHDIKIIESMPNGKDYVLFYLKLMVESIDHEGELRFSDTIPYNEQMLSVITGTNIDIVRAAMKIFQELKMVEVLDDQTIFMREVEALVGSETKWAEKKRLYREKKEDNVLALSSPCPTDVRQEKEIEKELETEIEKRERVEPPAAAPPPPKPVKHKWGVYGRVLLTEDEANRLLKDLGQSEFNRCVDYVDELAEQTHNKNGWKNWNLVVRRCHREGWGLRSQKQNTGFATGNPFAEMLEEELRRNGQS